jgi:hypothetical protein
MHQTKEPNPIQEFRPDCPRALIDICQTMMQKNRQHRIQDCREIARRLRAIQDDLALAKASVGHVSKNQQVAASGNGASSKSPVAVASQSKTPGSNRQPAPRAAVAVQASRATGCAKPLRSRTCDGSVPVANAETPFRLTDR